VKFAYQPPTARSRKLLELVITFLPKPEQIVADKKLKIKVARQVGYCYGVKRALDMAGSAADTGRKPIYTLGPIIHNPQVVESLRVKGIEAASSVATVDEGTVIIRSHGVEPSVIEQAQGRGLHVMDATCPFVKKAQRRAAELADAGYFVVILGEKDHPEVLSIMGHAGGRALVIEQTDDLKLIPKRERKIGLVTQTTQSAEKLEEIAGALASRVTELKVFNTICNATARRQADALELTDKVDVMLVVGGKNSANTSRLAQMCREAGTPTHHLETAEEISPDWFKPGDVVGVTTGASTSPDILRHVIDALEKMS
jgi:(E)-4-hydroxy-3-methyl-but-2-enyl pyrophosphate reductase